MAEAAFGAYITQHVSDTGQTGPLSGMSVAVKDLLVMANGQPSTAASQILASQKAGKPFVSPYDATVVRKLLDAGAMITGKTDMDEFAMGSSTENSGIDKDPCVNPHDASRVPGGTSGGSAVAVASGQVSMAIGTDTGGSIRQPAAFCGVVGIKPTYGRVSRYGVIADASSFDQVGVLATNVTDAALLLREISGHDPADATSVERDVPDYTETLDGKVKGLKIGIAKEYSVEGNQPEIEQATKGAAVRLQKAGAELVDVSLPHTEYGIAAYYIIQPAEASANLARYDGIRYGYSAENDDSKDPQTLEEVYAQTRAEGFGDEVKRRILLGTYVLSAGYYDAYYKKAMRVRTLIREDFTEAFKKCDVILAPTTPTTAFKRGEKIDDPLQMYLNDVYTVSANLAGIPGISVPNGADKQGLPIGLQLLGPQWGEETVLRVAHKHEQLTK